MGVGIILGLIAWAIIIMGFPYSMLGITLLVLVTALFVTGRKLHSILVAEKLERIPHKPQDIETY